MEPELKHTQQGSSYEVSVAVCSSLRSLKPKRTIESRAKSEDGNPVRANIKQALGRSEEKVEGALRVSFGNNKARNSKQNTFRRGNFSKGNNKGSTSQNSSFTSKEKAHNNTQGVHQANVSEEDQVDDEHLFMESHLDKHPDSLTWLMDSGCTSHMTLERSFFISLDTKDNPRVKLGDGRYTRAKGRGTIAINAKKGTKYIFRVLYVPELDRSMLSVSQMINNSYGVNFKNDSRCVINDSRDVKIATLDTKNDSYYLKLDVENASAFSVTKDDSMKWHKRFGHFNYRTLQHMYTTKLVRDMPPISEVDSKCEGCELGKSRSKNRTVMEMARSMLYEKNLPKTFWAEAVATSVYLLNKLATKAVSGKTPIEAWSGIKPSIQHLKVFGSISYYHILDIKRSKLDAKARKGIFVDYAIESNGYRIYDLTDSKIIISRDVTFDEGAYWNWNVDEVKRHEDMFSNEMHHDEVDIPEFDIEDTTDTHVLRTRPLVNVYESCNSIIELESYMDSSKHSEWIDAIKKQSEGFEVVGQEEKVYRLYKALYGIKQAPRAWYAKIDAHLLNHNFGRSSSESALCIKQFNYQERLIISLYVDDLLVIGSNDHLVKEFKKQMESELYMSDIGLVSYFLGKEIKQLPNGVHISQRKYASDMLKKFKMFLCKPVTSLLVYKCKLSTDDGKKLVNPTRFISIVGSLLYLTISRPDLAFAASFLSRFMGEPSSSHLRAAKRVLRYVNGSLDLGIMFERNKVVKLEEYADTDWAESIDDSKSTSGFIFTLGSGVFCWNSKKQSVVAQSSAEAEYISVGCRKSCYLDSKVVVRFGSNSRRSNCDLLR
uniref:Retrovirus-related Pol polyprotein from transposon TNT 1-94 n=1 Tax=Tanacetum cinerariifolium TaxID=118510 RepID=A0A6L2JJX6_TANCI|nr:retrovirus-related Pol polyprotein from transposon TNT 1-94 [Tanacetum cinerariifolium]